MQGLEFVKSWMAATSDQEKLTLLAKYKAKHPIRDDREKAGDLAWLYIRNQDCGKFHNARHKWEELRAMAQRGSWHAARWIAIFTRWGREPMDIHKGDFQETLP